MKYLSFDREARLLLAIVVLVLMAGAVAGFAQSTSAGTITGTVTDAQGAVIPDASITLTDASTHVQRKTVTNSVGLYVLPNVQPGNYAISAQRNGFSPSEIPSLTVRVGTQSTANFSLKVGSDTTVVQVEASNADLQTMNATVGETVEPVMVDSLPSIGRDVTTFAAFQPGVTPSGSVAGTLSDQAVFQLDGGNNSSDMDGSMSSYTGSFGNSTTGGFLSASSSGVIPMPQDSIEEFKVASTGQTADFNNSSGMQSQVVTKRGRDKWTGTTYEYYLNNNFGANSWQNNNPKSYTKKSDGHYSRFGAAAGGPILPNLLGGKTYLFVNYEGFRYPNVVTYERTVPSAAMLNGYLTLAKTGSTAAVSLSPDMLKSYDPRGLGFNATMKAFYAKNLPQQGSSYAGGTFDTSCGSISTSYCDGVNIIGYQANLKLPQSSNFYVARIDHDFGARWHWMASYRYYKLTQLTANQVDIGGFFSGDTIGTPTARSSRPQQPWYFVTSLTTNISPNLTNDFHLSYLRNSWEWKDSGAPAQISGAGGAIEPLGELTTSTSSTAAYSAVMAPFNVNTQDIRTRVWNGHDYFLRDDLTWLKGNHLIQFGGQYQHNFYYHNRSDNGNSINYTTTYQIGDSSGGGTVNYAGLSQYFSTSTALTGRLLDSYYGIVTDSQVANTYAMKSGTLTLNGAQTAIAARTTVPYYNLYVSDAWHILQNLTINYGLSYALEMPPTERDGNQVVWVDTDGKQISARSFLNTRAADAAQGVPYNPETGFELLSNLRGRKYPYDPYYGSISPRIALAYTPRFSGLVGKFFGDHATVIRGGYGRVYSRLNGDVQVLNPMMSPGLILAVQCRNVKSDGTCGSAAATDSTAFRIGTDGLTAPLATAPSTLAQPYFPGYSGPGVAVASPLDRSLRPSDVDTFNFSIQRQLGRRVTVEAGYIGRLIHHEYTMINPNQVPYMFAQGGQSFAEAYLALEQAYGCTTSASLCATNSSKAAAGTYPTVAAQSFFETALGGSTSAYCSGYANCTTAVLRKQRSNIVAQKVFSLWSALDGTYFTFGRTMMNTAIPGQSYGSSGQMTTGLSVGVSEGWGNYNGGYFSVKVFNWHGLTLQENLTYGKALGTYAFTQATSGSVPNDSFNVGGNYGVQSFDQKIIFNTFVVFETPWYKQQRGIVGRVAGGWTLSPVLTSGTGQPLGCTTNAGSQSFGGADGSNFSAKDNCVFTTPYKGGYHIHRNVSGGTDANNIAVGTAVKGSGNAALNMFKDPAAVYDTTRPLILGLDKKVGGYGPIRGLPYLNIDLSVKKKLVVRDAYSVEFTGVFFNVMNHLDFSSPSLSIATPTSFGVTKTQGNTPRMIQMGVRANF